MCVVFTIDLLTLTSYKKCTAGSFEMMLCELTVGVKFFLALVQHIHILFMFETAQLLMETINENDKILKILHSVFPWRILCRSIQILAFLCVLYTSIMVRNIYSKEGSLKEVLVEMIHYIPIKQNVLIVISIYVLLALQLKYLKLSLKKLEKVTEEKIMERGLQLCAEFHLNMCSCVKLVSKITGIGLLANFLIHLSCIILFAMSILQVNPERGNDYIIALSVDVIPTFFMGFAIEMFYLWVSKISFQ